MKRMRRIKQSMRDAIGFRVLGIQAVYKDCGLCYPCRREVARRLGAESYLRAHGGADWLRAF